MTRVHLNTNHSYTSPPGRPQRKVHSNASKTADLYFGGDKEAVDPPGIMARMIEMLKPLWNKLCNIVTAIKNFFFGEDTKHPPQQNSSTEKSEGDSSIQADSEEKTKPITASSGSELESIETSQAQVPLPQEAQTISRDESTTNPTSPPRNGSSSNTRPGDSITGRALETAKRKFLHRIHPNETEEQRAANAAHLGNDLIQALSKSISQKYEISNPGLFKDVQDIARELSILSYNTARVQTFNELTEANQDRMINLITFTLQHQEPLIKDLGREMAESIGLSPKTIELLRHSTED